MRRLLNLCTVFAPNLAMIVVIGTKIKKAGMFTKPRLKGALIPK